MSDPLADPAVDRATVALACAAVSAELGGVLLVGAEPAYLVQLARWWSTLWTASDRGGATIILAGAATTEEELWTRLRVGTWNGRAAIRVQPGPLITPAGPGAASSADGAGPGGGHGVMSGDSGPADPPVVVVVPDLPSASVAVKQAAVTTLGAPVAHLARNGLDATWRPRARWIAACPPVQLGQLPRHLVDRFGVIVPAPLVRPGPDGGLPWPAAPPAWHAAVRRSTVPPPAAGTIERVVELLDPPDGGWRDVALARLAGAYAALHGAAETTAAHVDSAARLIGLSVGSAPSGPDLDRPSHPDAVLRTKAPAAPADLDVPAGVDGPAVIGGGIVRVADTPEVLPPVPLAAPDAPVGESGTYRTERTDSVLRAQPAPRRPPAPRRRGGRSIGTGTLSQLRDVAIFATLCEAAKFQAVRAAPAGTAAFRIEASDLRVHRRARRTEPLLVLLLDHTCRRDSAWLDGLAPYLRWGYAVRSRIGVVEVGAAAPDPGYAARAFTVRGVLDPRVAEALDRPAGPATPLAHGLYLARDLLRREEPRQLDSRSATVLVVVTDGRGNIPLASSLTGEPATSVGVRGLTDAYAVARSIRTLRRARTVLLDPGAERDDLRHRLAVELGAEVAGRAGGPTPAGPAGDGGTRVDLR